MKILVTGGAGFVGHHLVKVLVAEGHQVTVQDNLSTGSFEWLPDSVKLVEKDILHGLCEEAELVIHMAAVMALFGDDDHQKDMIQNLLGSIRVFKDTAAMEARMIFVSTGAVFGGEGTPPYRENSPVSPVLPYGIHKLAAEFHLKSIGTNVPRNWTILRPSNIYGPGQGVYGKEGVVSKFINDIYLGRNVIINQPGNQTRDFIYIDDVISAINILVKNPTEGVVHASTEIETGLTSLANRIGFTLGMEPTIVLSREMPCMKTEAIRHSLASKRLKTHRWLPRTALKDGIRKTCDWYCSSVETGT